MRSFVAIGTFFVLLLSNHASVADTTTDEGSSNVVKSSEDGVSESSPEMDRLNRDVYRGEKMIGWGTLATLIGGAGVVTGVVIIARAASYESDPEQPTMGPGFAFAAGFSITGVSLIPLSIGIALLVKGNRKRESALEKLEHFPSVSLMSGGLYDTRAIAIGWSF